jgi:hypothetical protein
MKMKYIIQYLSGEISSLECSLSHACMVVIKDGHRDIKDGHRDIKDGHRDIKDGNVSYGHKRRTCLIWT